jgi:hypothetical protein
MSERDCRRLEDERTRSPSSALIRHDLLDTQCTGSFLGGLILGVTRQPIVDPTTGKTITLVYLRVLCRDDANEETVQRIRVPDGVDLAQFPVGATLFLPIRQIPDRTTNTFRLSLRADAPILAAPFVNSLTGKDRTPHV